MKLNLQLFGGFYPYNPGLGQVIQSDAESKNVDAAFGAHLTFSATEAVAAVTNGVKAAFATASGAATVVNTGFTQPTCPKNITLTTAGTAADIKAVQAVVAGTDFNDQPITETMPVFTLDTATTVVGSKAFKTVTSVTVPAMDGNGATVAVGFGEKLGVPYKLAHNTVLMAFLNNVKEGTAPTVATSATVLSDNTMDLNSALNGTVVDAYLLV